MGTFLKVKAFQKRKKGFVSLLGVVLTLLIILFLYYKMYYKPQAKSPQTEDALMDARPSNYKTIIDKSKDTIETINKQSKEKNKRMDEFL